MMRHKTKICFQKINISLQENHIRLTKSNTTKNDDFDIISDKIRMILRLFQAREKEI
ncbi:hypothetical protein HMPREF9162_0535 [Selenomonas sp. oral taxon 137 str. F0430]|jgi:hypothetical protein|nr:hypothetical protein HMPREF9162_0535 [Selenomonas sp. oral taxon 137 str. F0430]EJP28836.1 hypothetical protein HMPREF1147_1184 [Selenomonas sp. FOBRC9]